MKCAGCKREVQKYRTADKLCTWCVRLGERELSELESSPGPFNNGDLVSWRNKVVGVVGAQFCRKSASGREHWFYEVKPVEFGRYGTTVKEEMFFFADEVKLVPDVSAAQIHAKVCNGGTRGDKTCQCTTATDKKRVYVNERIEEQIKDIAENAGRKEVCGFVMKNSETGDEMNIRIENVSNTPESEYVMDAKEFNNVLQQTVGKNSTWKVLYRWHSHPMDYPFSSAKDRAHFTSLWTDIIWCVPKEAFTAWTVVPGVGVAQLSMEQQEEPLSLGSLFFDGN